MPYPESLARNQPVIFGPIAAQTCADDSRFHVLRDPQAKGGEKFLLKSAEEKR